jgi:hypothetical protein
VIFTPKIGQVVRVHYAAKAAPHIPYHGKIGTVEVVCKGRPRNHGIRIDGELVVIPCGNLQKVQETDHIAETGKKVTEMKVKP